MRELNQRIRYLQMPDRVKHLPLNDQGFPIPFFVPLIDGKPEFRGFDPDKLRSCVKYRRCWLCGEPLGKFMGFVIGPMCSINRVSAEPPSHYDCAFYAVQACPFLTQPRMRRNQKDLPENQGAAGIMLKRNPGVTLLWVTRSYQPFKAGRGVLFTIGDPQRVEFYAEGRKATPDEIMASIESGLPILREIAEQDGPGAVAELEQMYNRAIELVPT
jgi:hypothetical protein